MNYTQSDGYDTHPGTGQRLHAEDKAIPTAVSQADMNMLIWSLMEIVKAGGQTPRAFDKNDPSSYQVLKHALDTVYAGRANLLLNAEFMVNQRAYAGTASLTAKQYTWDRWRILESGYAVTAVPNGLGRTLTIPGGVHLEQVIEGINIEGGTYVVGWEGSATCTVNGVALPADNTFTVSAGANVTVAFTAGTLVKAWVVKGGTAGAFLPRPYDLDLWLCQRYFRSTFPRGVTPAQNAGNEGAIWASFGITTGTTTGYIAIWQFPFPMRVAPATTWYNPSLSWDGAPGGTNGMKQAGTFNNTLNGIRQMWSYAGGAVLSSSNAHVTADAEIY